MGVKTLKSEGWVWIGNYPLCDERRKEIKEKTDLTLVLSTFCFCTPTLYSVNFTYMILNLFSLYKTTQFFPLDLAYFKAKYATRIEWPIPTEKFKPELLFFSKDTNSRLSFSPLHSMLSPPEKIVAQPKLTMVFVIWFKVDVTVLLKHKVLSSSLSRIFCEMAEAWASIAYADLALGGHRVTMQGALVTPCTSYLLRVSAPVNALNLL